MTMYKQGDKVVCINTAAIDGFTPRDVTEGKVYEVAKDSTDPENVTVINDLGVSTGLLPRRFKLCEPKLDLTKPLETVRGDPVTLVLTDARGDFPLCGYIGTSEDLSSWNTEGKYYSSSANWRDLRNVPPKPREREVYVNVYENFCGKIFASTGFDSRTVADGNAVKNRLGCIKVKLVEGQYDE